MQKEFVEIKSNIKIAQDTYKMVVLGDGSLYSKPGMFINIQIEGKYLRRPISISDVNNDEITIIYKEVGEGTAWLKDQLPGKKLDVLSGLGNGFNTSLNYEMVIGGGLGVAPIYNLVKKLDNPIVIVGFRSKDDMFLIEQLQKLTDKLYVCTDDGSYGYKGFITQLINEKQLADKTFYCCGPLPLMKNLKKIMINKGQFSLEERMGCGFGACMGCSILTKKGPKRVCKEGPVFNSEDLIWED